MDCVVEKLEAKARQIRKEILATCCLEGAGHADPTFSCTEILVALYYSGILRFDPQKPQWAERDRFILSKGQANLILYPILADLGFFSKGDLERFNRGGEKPAADFQGSVPGVEITSGSVGHGFGIATGMAMAGKINHGPFLAVALLKEDECYEGSIWESAMYASHNGLNNLVAIVDRNHSGVTDFSENISGLEMLNSQWDSLGWHVENINGHSFREIIESFEGVRSGRSSKPVVIIADTIRRQGDI